MKKVLLILVMLNLVQQQLLAQIVNIPDANFKNYLVNNPNINTNGDAEIQVSEAAVFTDSIILTTGPNISDLTGIEAFTALTYLNCRQNSLTSLNVSANTALTYLDCYSNSLSSLDVSANTALTDLACSHNSLTGLDVSANTVLISLSCNYDSLTSLDVSANTALTELWCSSNSLLSLDVSANTALNGLACSYNSLTSLDVSANTVLIALECHYNSLTNLDVQNGNNINFDFFNANNNPNLICIKVDNAAWSTANWANNIGPWASFSENCTVGINDFNNSSLLVYPNPASSSIVINGEWAMNNGQLKIMNTQGQLVYQCVMGNEQLTIDVSALSKGIYFLSVFDGDKTVNRKFVKE